MVIKTPLMGVYFTVHRPVMYRPRCWSVCRWSSPTLSLRRSSLPLRSAPRSLSTMQVRGATREQSNSTKRLLCIVRRIARSVQPNQNVLCPPCSCARHALTLKKGLPGLVFIECCVGSSRFLRVTNLHWTLPKNIVTSSKCVWMPSLFLGDARVGSVVPYPGRGGRLPGAMQPHFDEWPV